MSETWSHWYLGGDNSGDVMVWRNVVEMRTWVKEEMGDVHLVSVAELEEMFTNWCVLIRMQTWIILSSGQASDSLVPRLSPIYMHT